MGYLCAMTKTVAFALLAGFGAVLAAAECGQRSFGENYVQEAVDKITAAQALAPTLNLEWHFIGPLQSNKTRLVAEHFAWVHSVDALKTAQRLSAQRAPTQPPLQVLIQVNVSGEASKSGCAATAAATLAHAVAALPRLNLRGLMAIPAPTSDAKQQLDQFAVLRQLFNELRASGLALDTLSIGMSADLEAAIASGSTLVRVGTAIFGTREYTH
jgi:pyridoxal phosphate enzyme (YggS family)